MKEVPLVLHVIHHLHMGGMENGLVNLVNNMPATRYRHAIACIEDYSDFRMRIKRTDVEVLALHRSRIGVWGLRKRIYELCRDMRPAIVHSRNMSGLDALLPARLAGATCVHGEHGRDVGDLDGENNRNAFLRRLHRPLVHRYISVSKDLERYLGKRVGVAAHRITQIYNGVDTTRFAPGAKPADVLPPHFYGEGKLVIGTVGRLQEVKDQATLIRAFASLLRLFPDAQLYLAIVGEGPMRSSLENLATELRLGDRVHFAGASNKVPEALRCLDIFVLPSLGEGISNTILEALATGLPVLASAVGGNIELVEPGESGEHFLAGDIAGLSKQLARYVKDETLRRRQGAAARASAVAQFSLDAMVSRYAAVYDELCAARR